jgi:hypothetical protein
MINAKDAKQIFMNIPCDISDILEFVNKEIIEQAQKGFLSTGWLDLGKQLTKREYNELISVLEKNNYQITKVFTFGNTIIDISWENV